MKDHLTDQVRTARITGLWYLTLAVTGMLGFLIVHPQVYDPNDPGKTLLNLTGSGTLARIRLLLEFAIVVSQALAAVWFYKLFRNIDDWGAWTLGIWGMMNSGVIMISAVAMGSAIDIANLTTQSHDEKIVLIQLLSRLITNAWGVGSLFFGLWLIPMGYIVLRSNSMPPWLGRILIIGGWAYLINTFIKYIGLVTPLADALVIPATIGEFWMIGYLLIHGIRVSNEQKEDFQTKNDQ